MPAIIDKIADALHLSKHHKQEEAKAADESPAPAPTAETQQPAESGSIKPKTPVFSSDKVTVFFVLGGPGAGKLQTFALVVGLDTASVRLQVKEPSARTWYRISASVISLVQLLS